MSQVGNKGTERVSLLGPKSVLKGDFATSEELVILGEVDGARVESPNITVGPAAAVRADIHAGRIRIEGRVTGDVHATVSIVVLASAIVEGDLYSPEITIREGATLVGAVNLDPGVSVEVMAEDLDIAAQPHRVPSARSA